MAVMLLDALGNPQVAVRRTVREGSVKGVHSMRCDSFRCSAAPVGPRLSGDLSDPYNPRHPPPHPPNSFCPARTKRQRG